MNITLLLNVLGILFLCEAALMLPSLGVAIGYGDGDAKGILISILITAVVGLILKLTTHPGKKDATTREGLAIAGFSWIFVSVFGALPFVLTKSIPNFVDAYFETVSGFTTTGASILSNMEALPHGITFWRCMTHWFGGMGILVFTVALLPKITGRATFVARAESPGPTFSKLLPKLSDTAKLLYAIYLLLTAILVVALIIAGMTPFDAIIHSFSTAGTGGFSNYSSSIASFNNPAIEWILSIGMWMFGVNFAVYFHIIRHDLKENWKNEEFFTYVGIVVACTLLITLNLTGTGMSFGTSIRQALFQSTSISSTTGFVSADFDLWPTFSKVILLFLMFMGACAGSTCGGLKVSRLLLLFKTGKREISRAISPRKVFVIRVDGKVIPEETVQQLGNYLFLNITLTFLGVLCFSLDGLDVVSAFTGSLTLFNNVGPALNQLGPTMNFSILSPVCKYFGCFLMLAGRLEIFPILTLFAPDLWKN